MTEYISPLNPNIRARVVADSISPRGDRLTTIEVTHHRWVLAEMNTHRRFSRNSASSRAIPISKRVEAVKTNCAIPVEWGSNQPGMQAGSLLEEENVAQAIMSWLWGAKQACLAVKEFEPLNVHKQITNRLLEPFLYHTAIITSTEWDNFFEQRCSPLAQPEIREAAIVMRAALRNSVPVKLKKGQYHLPYLQPDERDLPIEIQIHICVARCARVSYLTHDGKREIDADVNLYYKLATAEPPHWSPMEHVATPLGRFTPRFLNLGNFTGWRQHRHEIDGSPSPWQVLSRELRSILRGT